MAVLPPPLARHPLLHVALPAAQHIRELDLPLHRMKERQQLRTARSQERPAAPGSRPPALQTAAPPALPQSAVSPRLQCTAQAAALPTTASRSCLSFRLTCEAAEASVASSARWCSSVMRSICRCSLSAEACKCASPPLQPAQLSFKKGMHVADSKLHQAQQALPRLTCSTLTIHCAGLQAQARTSR